MRRGNQSLDVILFLLATPALAVRTLVRAVRRVEFWRAIYRTSSLCGSCGATISLVGLWRCQCGFTYEGHLLQVCPVCGALPKMMRCYQCGVTETLPQP